VTGTSRSASDYVICPSPSRSSLEQRVQVDQLGDGESLGRPVVSGLIFPLGGVGGGILRGTCRVDKSNGGEIAEY
jgi:hypothetical protein